GIGTARRIIGHRLRPGLIHSGRVRWRRLRLVPGRAAIFLRHGSDGDHPLTLRHVEDPYAHRLAGGDADLVDGGADHLPAIGDEDDVEAGRDREAGGDGEVAVTHRHRPDALAAPPGEPVAI